jgi:hypothetical protein
MVKMTKTNDIQLERVVFKAPSFLTGSTHGELKGTSKYWSPILKTG